MTIAQADSTYAYIEKKIRRLTASSAQSSLSSADIQTYVNIYYSADFPYAIKLDQMRSVYTFFTEPYRDRYPLDVNYNQGVRSPIYFEGIVGAFTKDRQQFNAVWPRFPYQSQPISGDGMNQGPFNFTTPGPFLSREVVLGGVDINNNPISVNDDGYGNLYLQTPNPVISIPANTPASNGIPGMKNQNTGNPGLNNLSYVGSVNYVTGAFSVDFTSVNITPIAGQNMTLWVSQYQTGRPYSMLFWNNEFTIRPVPKLIHKVEVETYLTPVAFLQTSDSPILNQWSQCLAYGAAMEILRDRQDMEGVENLREGFMRQEALVLERQAVEELFQPNLTIFNSANGAYGVANGMAGGGF